MRSAATTAIKVKCCFIATQILHYRDTNYQSMQTRLKNYNFRLISTARLNTLLCIHLQPINRRQFFGSVLLLHLKIAIDNYAVVFREPFVSIN